MTYNFPKLSTTVQYWKTASEEEVFATLPQAPAGMCWRVSIERDEDSEAPWKNDEGHGPVSGWTRRDKKPGELIIKEERGQYRFFDFAECVRIARRDGWSCDGMPEGVSRGERAALAARQNFEFLQAWCANEWEYVGVSVWLVSEDTDEEAVDRYRCALWCIESFCVDYIKETAGELANECLSLVQAKMNPVCECGI